MKTGRNTRSATNFFGSNLFQRFGLGRVLVLATLTLCLMGTVSGYGGDNSVFEYPHNESSGTTAYDFSGKNNDGTYDGVQFNGESIDLDTGGDKVTTIDPSFDNDITVHLQFTPDKDYSGSHYFFNNYKGGNGNYFILGEAGGDLWFQVDDGSTQNNVYSSTGTIQAGKRYNVTAYYDYSEGETGIKVNGNSIKTNSNSIGSVDYGGQTIDIGSKANSHTKKELDGTVFESKIYSERKTDSEIANLNNCGALICNTAPSYDSVSTTPSSWTLDSSINVSADVSDSDGTVSSVEADVWENGTQIVSDASLSDSDNDGIWEVDNLFTVDESEVVYKYELTATDDDGATSTYSESREVDFTDPRINITSPESPTENIKGLSLNYTVSDPNLNSSTCKYSKDGGTNFSLQNCGNTTIDYGSVGLHNLTVYASDTFNNTGKDFKQIFVDEVNEIRAKDKETDTEISNFSVTLSNGTESIGGQAVNGSFRFNSSNSPTGDVNLSLVADGYRPFNEQFQIDDSFTLNQSFGLERAGLYIDAKDEKTEGDIQFNLTLSNSTYVYSKEDITEFQEDYKDFADKNITTGEVTASISSSGYQTREYFYSIDENSKISLTPYLLAKNQGIYVSLEVYDSAGNDLQDATLTIQRQFSGEWKTVSQKTTETTGGASFFLDPETTYRFVASKSGYETFRGTFSPSNYQYDPLKIYLGTQNQDSYSTVLEAVEYSLRPQEGIISGVQKFELNVTDKEEKLSSFGLRAFNESGDLEKSSIVQTSPSGGSTSLQVNTTGMGNEITVESFFQRENQTYSYQNTYRVLRPLDSGELSLIQSKRYLEKHLSMFARSLLTLLIVVGVTLPASKSERLDTNGAGVVGLAILGVATANNFFPGAIFILTLLPVIGIYLMRIR